MSINFIIIYYVNVNVTDLLTPSFTAVITIEYVGFLLPTTFFVIISPKDKAVFAPPTKDTFASFVVALVENEPEANVKLVTLVENEPESLVIFFMSEANEPDPSSLAFITSVMTST